MPEKKVCEVCDKEVSLNKDGELRLHGPRNEPCPGGAQPRPKTIDEKADLYIAEGRVKVVEKVGDHAKVKVQGSREDPYTVIVRGSAASCDCEARKFFCTHVRAALKILDIPYGPPSLFSTKEHDDLFGSRVDQVPTFTEEAMFSLIGPE